MENKTTVTEDSSIIDVTGEAYKLNYRTQDATKKDQDLGVPTWSHQYVYSYAEINRATGAQIRFYKRFKESFLNSVYLDLEGNTNYAFILLFDLLTNEYEKHGDLTKLEDDLAALGHHYPKTKSYATSFLIQKMEAAGDRQGVERLRGSQYSYYNSYQSNYGSEYWKLGSKYKTKLALTEEETVLLNKLWDPGNNFCGVEFCLLEVSKLYLAIIKKLGDRCAVEGSSLQNEFKAVSDVVARKYFKYRSNSNNYKYSIESTSNELYGTIFKHCENAVREYYGHKRKVSTETVYHTIPEVAVVFEEKLTTRINAIIPELLSSISLPDEATENELNAQNTTRWKTRFEEIAGSSKGSDGKQFIKDIRQLGELNKKNPSLENIYFEASKFIAKTDGEAALVLYIHYLYYDLQSVAFNNKQFTKTVQKSLFKTEEQLNDFKAIINELIRERDLEKAVQAVSSLYAPKRKKIQINRDAIKEVQQQHAGTVELLNEYLQEDDEPVQPDAKNGPADTIEEEISFESLIPRAKGSDGFFLDSIALSGVQCDLLRLFADNNFTIAQKEVEVFSKVNKQMRNQLIDSINETCYEQLDDVLIEEEGEYYMIYENYFQQLIKK
ncbi:hypothetical protein GCM10023188_43920 [Pontibacter saemangeumensis]|uniref:TerB-C domain-containing protein n=2 Tax=Pontibacter saemangeumensis TaxID=1084525 RepID=A0ABP8M2J3_9BACT